MTSPPTDPDPNTSLPGLRRWQQALLLSVRLRKAAWLLLIFYASALVASSLPLQLLSSRWYLNAAEVLMANAPIAITAACLLLLAQVLQPPLAGGSRQGGRIRFQQFCSGMALLYFMVLPLQLLAASYFAFELHDAERSRLQAFQNQQLLISKRLQTASTIDSLNALLPPPPSQANATLQQRRTAISKVLASDLDNLRQRLSSERLQRLIQLLFNSLRIVITALATALFFRMLGQPSGRFLARHVRSLRKNRPRSLRRHDPAAAERPAQSPPPLNITADGE